MQFRAWPNAKSITHLTACVNDPFVVEWEERLSLRYPHAKADFVERSDEFLVCSYQRDRKIPATTTFYKKNGKILIDKTPIKEKSNYKMAGPTLSVEWIPSSAQAYIEGEDFTHANISEFKRFLSWSLSHWKKSDGLDPLSIDALFINALKKNQGFELFDLEWKLGFSVNPSWFILRNCFALGRYRGELNGVATNLKALYETICSELNIKSNFESDLRKEAELQSLTSANDSISYHERELTTWFLAPLGKQTFVSKLLKFWPFTIYGAGILGLLGFILLTHTDQTIIYQDDMFYLAPKTFESGLLKNIYILYTTTSGRLGEITSAILWNRMNAWFSLSPWGYPWFFLKVLPFVPLTLAFATFLLAFTRVTKTEAWIVATSLWIGWWSFAVNDTIVWSMTFVLMLVNYTTPILVYALMSSHYLSKPTDWHWNKKIVALFTLIYLYIALTHEQLLVFTSVVTPLIVAYPFLRSEVKWKAFYPRALLWLGVQITALGIFFLSPGQSKRAEISGVNFALHPQRYRIEATQTLMKLFSLDLAKADERSRFILQVLLVSLIVSIVKLVRNRFKIKSDAFGLWIIGNGFFIAGYLSQASLLVANYFPDRAKLLPMLFFMTGLSFMFVSLIRFVSEKAYYFKSEIQTVCIALAIAVVPSGVIQLKKTTEIWSAWYTLDHGRMVLYRKMQSILASTDRNLVFDHDSCKMRTYDNPETIMKFLEWVNLLDRVEFKVAGKIINQKHKPVVPEILSCND